MIRALASETHIQIFRCRVRSMRLGGGDGSAAGMNVGAGCRRGAAPLPRDVPSFRRLTFQGLFESDSDRPAGFGI